MNNLILWNEFYNLESFKIIKHSEIANVCQNLLGNKNLIVVENVMFNNPMRVCFDDELNLFIEYNPLFTIPLFIIYHEIGHCLKNNRILRQLSEIFDKSSDKNRMSFVYHVNAEYHAYLAAIQMLEWDNEISELKHALRHMYFDILSYKRNINYPHFYAYKRLRKNPYIKRLFKKYISKEENLNFKNWKDLQNISCENPNLDYIKE